jgi:pimeloyl-ACP methyl ester carboxylesterase
MATVARPQGVEIHWEAHGSGPAVLIAHQLLWSYPQVYADLIRDLATDHCVVTYDPRGCGRSSTRGPYDAETDAGDLLAVVEAAGGHAVALAVGYGYNLAVRVAARRPELISALVTIQPAAAALLPRSELRESGVLAASESVIEMLMQMMSTDPRTALRTVLAATNPDLDEDQLRERLDRVSDYMSAEAAQHRAAAWIADDPSEHARALGDRLVIVHSEAEPLFEGQLAGRVAQLYPEALVEELPGGPISRPDLVAARLRTFG